MIAVVIVFVLVVPAHEKVVTNSEKIRMGRFFCLNTAVVAFWHWSMLERSNKD